MRSGKYMRRNRVTLEEAIKFHGHLGPYLVLGLLAGSLSLKKLRAKKYFGLRVRVWGAAQKPKSCFIDGLQLSTGATYGKGNIEKLNGPSIKAEFYDCASKKKIVLTLKAGVIQRLNEAKTHKDCEILAKELFKTNCNDIFDLTETANNRR